MSRAVCTLSAALLLSTGLIGCISDPARPGAPRATKVDVSRADPAYWLKQPAVTSVTAPEFDRLWRACRLTARDLGFKLDRQEYREGVLTTQPLISQQAFEPWKRDVASTWELAQSTLGTVRRTIRFDIRKQPDGSFRCEPKVIVERYSTVEHRITSATQYRDIFTLTRLELRGQREHQLDPTAGLPPVYWYPIARDRHLEERIAGDVRDRLKT